MDNMVEIKNVNEFIELHKKSYAECYDLPKINSFGIKILNKTYLLKTSLTDWFDKHRIYMYRFYLGMNKYHNYSKEELEEYVNHLNSKANRTEYKIKNKLFKDSNSYLEPPKISCKYKINQLVDATDVVETYNQKKRVVYRDEISDCFLDSLDGPVYTIKNHPSLYLLEWMVKSV